MNIQLDDHNHARERIVEAAEAEGFVVIDRDELLAHYGELREMHEGRYVSVLAAETAINYLFDVLGEPGAGE